MWGETEREGEKKDGIKELREISAVFAAHIKMGSIAKMLFRC